MCWDGGCGVEGGGCVGMEDVGWRMCWDGGCEVEGGGCVGMEDVRWRMCWDGGCGVEDEGWGTRDEGRGMRHERCRGMMGDGVGCRLRAVGCKRLAASRRLTGCRLYSCRTVGLFGCVGL